jgi:hypothetical protein
VPDVSSIILFSAQPDRTIAFYRSLGIEFEDEDHGDGRIGCGRRLRPRGHFARRASRVARRASRVARRVRVQPVSA